MSDTTHNITCSCGYAVDGTPAFVIEQYDHHLTRCKENVAPSSAPEGQQLIRRAIADVAGSNTTLRKRLEGASADLAAAGYSPHEIADRLTTGESLE